MIAPRLEIGRPASCRAIALILVLAGAERTAGFGAETSPPPNVLLILTDDQGWGDLHGHGNRELDTPVLDGLSRRSVTFDRFFVSPVCAPTRAGLLTGRYDIRTGVSGVTGRLEVMRDTETTLAELLQPHGYATGCFGKWHNGRQFPHHPLGQGFDEFFGFCGGHWNDYFDTALEHNGRTVMTQGYITDTLTDAARRFIHQFSDRPFLCYVPFNACHAPLQVPDVYFDKYARRGLAEDLACTYGMIENIDSNVGRLLEALEQEGLTGRTIVVFLTDNGPNGARFNGGMRGTKGSVHEGGVRVPCFISWPGHIEPHAVSQIAAHVDLLPTLIELCGLPLPDSLELDGRSLVPLLRGSASASTWPDRMLFTYRPGNRVGRPDPRGAIRTQQYRFVRDRDADELYDLQQDPGETTNLARSHPDVLARFQQAFDQEFAEARTGIAERIPIPVGYTEMPQVELPAVEAQRTGGVVFANQSGYAHDWIVQWTRPEDRIAWELQVVTPGTYEVLLRYACSPADVGSTVRLSAGGESLTFTIERAFDTGREPRPERDLRKGTRWVREFTTMPAGRLRLPAGRTLLSLQAEHVPGQSVCELEGLVLRKVAAQ
jgi:arylsulfatase A